MNLCEQLDLSASRWWIDHQRKRAAESGVAPVARNLRKQGVPLWVALLILGRHLVPMLKC